MTPPSGVSASVIAIGDELLSGRTQDKNIAHIAKFLNVKGIQLCEVRIVADEERAIVEAVNHLRAMHDYIFTSGGIGPTHDDITTDAIGRAFGREVAYHREAYAMLEAMYQSRNIEFTTARKKMARVPVGAQLIKNNVSVAPGFILENVYVMAGVPSVFNAMLLEVEPQLKEGQKLLSATIECQFGEGTIGDALTKIAGDFPNLSIGSYPRFDGDKYNTQIVVRGPQMPDIKKAEVKINKMLEQL